MNEDFTRRLHAALEALEPSLDKAGSAPVGPGDDAPVKTWLSADEQIEMRRGLKKLTTNEIWGVFGTQASKEGQGLPLSVWMSSGGGRALDSLMASNPTVRKALDTTSGYRADPAGSRAAPVRAVHPGVPGMGPHSEGAGERPRPRV